MANDYIITLKRPSYRAIDMVSVILLLLFLFSYGFYLMQFGLTGRRGWLILIPVMIISLMTYGFLQRHREDYLVYYRTELFIAALGWFLIPIYEDARYIGWAYALMAFVERYVKYPDEWVFSTEEVVHKVFPRKVYDWVEIDNVMIRDNLFTLDLRNNKIVQKELDLSVSKETEMEFNDWCKQQLHFKPGS